MRWSASVGHDDEVESTIRAGPVWVVSIDPDAAAGFGRWYAATQRNADHPRRLDSNTAATDGGDVDSVADLIREDDLERAGPFRIESDALYIATPDHVAVDVDKGSELACAARHGCG